MYVKLNFGHKYTQQYLRLVKISFPIVSAVGFEQLLVKEEGPTVVTDTNEFLPDIPVPTLKRENPFTQFGTDAKTTNMKNQKVKIQCKLRVINDNDDD